VQSSSEVDGENGLAVSRKVRGVNLVLYLDVGLKAIKLVNLLQAPPYRSFRAVDRGPIFVTI